LGACREFLEAGRVEAVRREVVDHRELVSQLRLFEGPKRAFVGLDLGSVPGLKGQVDGERDTKARRAQGLVHLVAELNPRQPRPLRGAGLPERDLSVGQGCELPLELGAFGERACQVHDEERSRLLGERGCIKARLDRAAAEVGREGRSKGRELGSRELDLVEVGMMFEVDFDELELVHLAASAPLRDVVLHLLRQLATPLGECEASLDAPGLVKEELHVARELTTRVAELGPHH